jgi:hypothetical protein
LALVASACSSHGAAAQPSDEDADEDARVLFPPRPRAGEDPRLARTIEGLERVRRGLEAGTATPNAAFDAIEALEQEVGPPAIVIPPHEDACTSDDECGLTDRLLDEDAGGYRCCAGTNIYSAGNLPWIRELDEACDAYEPLRGTRAIELPTCGVYTGPISANATRCAAGRCVACFQRHDGSAATCR